MNWIKRHKLFILLLLFVYGFYFFSQYSSHKTYKHVLGTKNNLVLITEPQDGREPIINALKSANKSLDVEMYLLSDKQIIDALLSEKEEGVSVKVMLEEHPYGAGNINQRSKAALEKAHIPVKWTNPSFALTHEKGVIIDGQEALILTQNLTASAFDKNREYDILDANPLHAAEIEKMFQADWDRRSFAPMDSALIISPDNARGKFISLLKNSKSTLAIETEILQDQDVVTVLSEKAKTMHVSVIIPDITKVPSNTDAAKKLLSAGVEVRQLANPYIHGKLIISDDAKAYVGSGNFSTQSMDQNRELGIVILESDVILSLDKSFETDWTNAAAIR